MTLWGKINKLELFYGRPESADGRLDKEIRTYNMLDKLGIEYRRVDHEATETMEACAKIDEFLQPVAICKNLFLCNSQKTSFYLLAMKSGKKFKSKDISKQAKSTRLSFAPSEFMEEFLDITPGSVSVLGLMNDTNNRVQLLVDEDLLNDEYFVCHPCVNTSSVKLKTTDVFDTFLKAVHHDYIVVTVKDE